MLQRRRPAQRGHARDASVAKFEQRHLRRVRILRDVRRRRAGGGAVGRAAAAGAAAAAKPPASASSASAAAADASASASWAAAPARSARMSVWLSCRALSTAVLPEAST